MLITPPLPAGSPNSLPSCSVDGPASVVVPMRFAPSKNAGTIGATQIYTTKDDFQDVVKCL